MPTSACLASDKASEFNQLLQTYGDLTYQMAFQITGGQEADARDLVQDAFLKVWSRWETERPENPKAWMYRLMRNMFNDQLRRKYRRPTLSLDASMDSPFPLGDVIEERRCLPDEEIEKEDLQTSVSQALQELPVEFRIPVVLCDMGGLSYAEIAEMLSCPIGTVRSRIYRARLQLRDLLKNQYSQKR